MYLIFVSFCVLIIPDYALIRFLSYVNCTIILVHGVMSHPLAGSYVRYILAGISEGFRISFRRDMTLCSALRNMPSALKHPEVLQAYLDTKRTRGRMLGPFSPADQPSLLPCHVSRFGVIPKRRNTGKWCLITDLSFPQGCKCQ